MADKENAEPLPIEEVRRRIVTRLGIEEDELKTLYPSEHALREFYEKEVVSLKAVDNAEADWPEDDFQLTQDAQQELLASKNRLKEQDENKHKAKTFVKQEREKLRRKDEFKPVAQDHLPKKERVSLKDLADVAKSLKDLNLEGD